MQLIQLTLVYCSSCRAR